MEFGTTQPSCVKDTLLLICRINSSLADFIEWNITLRNITLGNTLITENFTFSTERHSVGDTITNYNDRVTANLTDNVTMLASSIKITPQLNDISGTNRYIISINNTIIRCRGGNSNESNTTSVDTHIILQGEELKMYLITNFLNRTLLILNSYRNIFPLSIVQVYLHLLPT